jgi:hypothetical protein
MEDGMENYIKYKLMGGKNKFICCVGPHIFQCQTDGKRVVEVIANVASKCASRRLLEEAMSVSVILL